MVNVRGSLKQGNADVDRNVAQCAAVLKICLEKVKEASVITETCT